MTERKIKREDNTVAFDLEEAGFTVKPAKVDIGSGYAVALGYDENDEAIVNVKTYGNVDVAKVHRELERLFPNAKIKHSEQKPSVAVIRKHKKKRE